jgi:ribosomal protein S18 acetylase RimI-like enzyme
MILQILPLTNELCNEGFNLPQGDLNRYAIELLGVKSQFRGRGIGKILINRCVGAVSKRYTKEPLAYIIC